MFRRLTPPQLAFDIGLAAACVLLRWTISEFLALWFVVLAMALALALRRLSPALALAVAWVGAIAQLATLRPPDISNIAILAVLFATARYGERITRWAGLVSAIVGAGVATVYMLVVPSFGLSGGNSAGIGAGPHLATVGVIGFGAALAVLGLSWTLGLLTRTWTNARDSRRRQAAAEQTVVVEQERNRIARDMHDVVAHSLAVVIAQADGARYAKGVKPKDEALATIAGTARDALADVRLLLGQLRHSQEAGPQPVLADLGRLVDQLQASGLVVDLQQYGGSQTLPAAQQLALYRIVQEALTNALRHGDTSAPAQVDIHWSDTAVDATVSSALGGPAAAASAPGHGIAGMRERALLVGGTLDAAPRGDRYVVTAHIPVLA